LSVICSFTEISSWACRFRLLLFSLLLAFSCIPCFIFLAIVSFFSVLTSVLFFSLSGMKPLAAPGFYHFPLLAPCMPFPAGWEQFLRRSFFASITFNCQLSFLPPSPPSFSFPLTENTVLLPFFRIRRGLFNPSFSFFQFLYFFSCFLGFPFVNNEARAFRVFTFFSLPTFLFSLVTSACLPNHRAKSFPFSNYRDYITHHFLFPCLFCPPFFFSPHSPSDGPPHHTFPPPAGVCFALAFLLFRTAWVAVQPPVLGPLAFLASSFVFFPPRYPLPGFFSPFQQPLSWFPFYSLGHHRGFSQCLSILPPPYPPKVLFCFPVANAGPLEFFFPFFLWGTPVASASFSLPLHRLPCRQTFPPSFFLFCAVPWDLPATIPPLFIPADFSIPIPPLVGAQCPSLSLFSAFTYLPWGHFSNGGLTTPLDLSLFHPKPI